MKRIILALCLIFAARIYADDAGPFQLFSGTIWRNERPMPVVLKINTQTGQTWQLLDVPTKVEGVEQQSYMTGWTPVVEDVLTELLKLQGRTLWDADTQTAQRKTPLITSISVNVYEIPPRKDHRGVNLISDALPFNRLWYTGRMQSAMQSDTRNSTADHIML
jgi:hypothetical protein